MDEATRKRTLETELPNGIDGDIARDAELYERNLDLPHIAADVAARDLHGDSTRKASSEEIESVRDALARETGPTT